MKQREDDFAPADGYAGWEWSKIATAGVPVMLPLLVFTSSVRANRVQGLMVGGVKE